MPIPFNALVWSKDKKLLSSERNFIPITISIRYIAKKITIFISTIDSTRLLS